MFRGMRRNCFPLVMTLGHASRELFRFSPPMVIHPV